MKFLISIMMMVLIVSGCSSNDERTARMEDPGKNSEPMTEPADTLAMRQDVEVLATQLQVPWQINVLDDAVYYLSGRSGDIISVKGESQQLQSVELGKPVVSRSESGLLGFLIINENKEPLEAFLYHTYEEDGRLLNRVVKAEMQDSAWKEKDVLIDGIPGGPIHNGGRLAIGPDRLLYITTGDAGDENQAQDLDSLAGKILRLNLDGSIPEDNPFHGSPVYSYGHRNPQGMGWSPDGTMYSSEHGPSGHDEINRIVPGENYGWPLIIGDETKEGMKSPIFHSGNNTWAPSGLAVHDEKLYVAFLAGEQIREFDVKNGTHRMWKDGFGRMRDVTIEEGSLYAVTNNTDGRGNPSEEDDQLLKFSFE